MATKRIDHVGVMVKDLETTIRFYTEIVGLEVKSRVAHTNGVLQLAFLGAGGSDETEIELIQGYNDQLPAEGKVHHFAVTVDDVEAEHERIKSLNIPFVPGFEEITALPNGHRYFFIHGPDKEWIEFFQR
ncbi:glyoxalase/bleomycin resistance/dioxygenase family protein [Cohnella sp. CIP 111063]|mgnify:CR=1 FL=1|jgi:Lactoylglutathione lyase and related lyases|uniref:VOC family protein n=1 Tax=unclassified Cohnella TaxID=2636738 RepID=UPI000B8C0CEB|nr:MULTISPECIES: VOC family protein [unclassified Cohnella]OXS58410.1 glyoxalase/bleomycin resistance/dioxygenase family protein [Cohnella sp. CIP 111063]PRX71698.1 lactoylglutathione lyase [Cohnella sp. SGD-V74]